MFTLDIGHLLTAGKAILPLVPYGGPALKAVEAVIDTIDDVKTTMSLSPENAAALDNTRDELERAVNAHADRTAASLG